MRITRRYNQHRRDLHIDMVCEACGYNETNKSAYDDTNFWVNVVPNMMCERCGIKTMDLDITIENIGTKYPEGYQV